MYMQCPLPTHAEIISTENFFLNLSFFLYPSLTRNSPTVGEPLGRFALFRVTKLMDAKQRLARLWYLLEIVLYHRILQCLVISKANGLFLPKFCRLNINHEFS